VISVPDLQGQSSRDLGGRFIPRKHGLFFGDDNLLLSSQILKRENEAPVEITLPGQRAVMDISGLGIIWTFQPTTKKYVTFGSLSKKVRISKQFVSGVSGLN